MFKNFFLITGFLFISLIPSISYSEDGKWCTSSVCVNSSNFEINVGNITPWYGKPEVSSWQGKIIWILKDLIEKLMIALWVLALFMMTIGWWFMIISYWQEDLINRWKNIFTSWLIALVVALSSWLLVRFISYLVFINK